MPSLTSSPPAVTTGDIYRSPGGRPSVLHFLFRGGVGAQTLQSFSGAGEKEEKDSGGEAALGHFLGSLGRERKPGVAVTLQNQQQTGELEGSGVLAVGEGAFDLCIGGP